MNIQEMHTGIQAEMNKMNSFLFDTFTPQEIDLAINKCIMMFVNQRYSPLSNPKQKGFEMSQKRIDDLRTLVVSNYTERTVFPQTYDADYGSKVQFFFPGNYYHSVATRFKVAANPCGGVTYQKMTGSYTVYYFDLSNAVLWSSFRMRRNTDTPISINDATLSYDQTDRSFVARIYKQRFEKQYPDFSKYEFYYENFRGTYRKNNIIIVSKDNSVFQYSTNNGSTYVNMNTFTYNYEYYEATPNITTSGKLVQQDDIFAMQADPFNKTSSDFPLYYISDIDNNIYINSNEFVITHGILSYIRMPNTVSLLLDENCDLPEGTHPEIVSMTANYLLEVSQAGERFQTHQTTVIQSE